jgi:hypothetical protein
MVSGVMTPVHVFVRQAQSPDENGPGGPHAHVHHKQQHVRPLSCVCIGHARAPPG